MSERPLVSFYILAYNHSAFIEDAIRGALAQSYTPLEIIISDDASTDDTRDRTQRIISGYAGPHIIKFVQQQNNLGIGEHINAVWEQCSGEWIVASAGDDISEPNRVATIMETVRERKDIYLVQSYLYEIDEHGNELGVNKLTDDFEPKDSYLLKWGFNDRLCGKNPFPTGASFAYSRNLLNAFPSRLRKEIIFEDNVLNWRAELLNGMAMLRQPLVRHRNHNQQISKSVGLRDIRIERERRKISLDSDVVSCLHNLEDTELAINAGMLNVQTGSMAQHFVRRRLLFFKMKRAALLGIWPIRLIPLFYCLSISPRILKWSRRELYSVLLPDTIFDIIIKKIYLQHEKNS